MQAGFGNQDIDRNQVKKMIKGQTTDLTSYRNDNFKKMVLDG